MSRNRRRQSGASQVFVAMAIVLWLLASFIASAPVVAALSMALAAAVCLVASIVLWAWVCFRKNST